MFVPPRLNDDRGFTLIELAIVIIVLGALMSLAVAALLRARVAANEGTAINSLRTINSAQFVYQGSCGNGLFAQSLLVLGTRPPGESTAYLNEDLGYAANPSHNGYTFGLTTGAGGAPGPNDCNGVATRTNYYATARATTQGETGTRAFATSQVGVIWERQDGTLPTEPFGPPARLVQ